MRCGRPGVQMLLVAGARRRNGLRFSASESENAGSCDGLGDAGSTTGCSNVSEAGRRR